MRKRARHGKNTRGQSSSSQEISLEDKIRKFRVFDNDAQQMHYDTLATRYIHSRSFIDWALLAKHGLYGNFFESIHSDPFSFESTACRYDPEHKGIKFRLGGEARKISLLELGWRVGLYFENRSREDNTLSGFCRAETIKANHVLLGFWPSIRDGEFVVRGTSVKEVRDPRVRLAYLCIATTISGQKDSTQRITEIDLFYLYCIYALGGGACYWPTAREAGEGDESEGAGEEEAGGSAYMYRDMIRGDWQAHQGLWMDQMDNQ
ncbi:hypothetical protein Tco_0173923 [Tanacetum coccineum]